MKLSDFNDCHTADAFLARAGGDVRLAETAAWAFWEQSGQSHRDRDDRYSLIAQQIANTKWSTNAKSHDGR